MPAIASYSVFCGFWTGVETPGVKQMKMVIPRRGKVDAMKNVLRQFAMSLIMLGVMTMLPLSGDLWATATMSDYCTVPPFVQTTVTPNVMIVIDFSGSMQFPAYLPCDFTDGYGSSGYTAHCSQGTTANTGANYDATNNPSSADPNKTGYYGYFDKTAYYWYNSSGYFTVNSCTPTTAYVGQANTCISGNLLNWLTATRVDVARRVMTGGRTGGSGTGTYLDSEGAVFKYQDNNLHCVFNIVNSTPSTPATRKLYITNQTGYTCALGTLGSSSNPVEIQILKDSSSIVGIVDDFYSKVTFDFMYFNSSNKGVIPTGGIKGAALADLKSAINTQLPYNGTPTGEALWEVYDFYQQNNGHSYASNTSAIGKGTYAKDPYYDNVSSTSVAIPCRKSFALLLSDGAWNGDVDPVISARYLRRGDLRSDTGLGSNQYATVYPIFTFGDLDAGTKAQGRTALITTAIFGGYTNYSSDSWPYPFTGYTEGLSTDCGSSYDNSNKSNITDVSGNTWCNSRAVNNGSAPNNYPLSQCNPSGTYGAKCKYWDPEKKGLPYNYFEADDGQKLETAVTNALSEMIGRVSSGTAASVLASSQGSGANILQAIFYPTRMFGTDTLLWSGEMQDLWYYIDPYLTGSAIREDTDQNKKLDLNSDYVTDLYFDPDDNQVKAKRSTTDGTLVDIIGLDEVHNLWEAGSQLWSRSTSRTLYTTLDGSNLTTFDASTASASGTFRTYLQAADATEAAKIVNYVAGTDQTGYRSRTVTIGTSTHVWKLGDIINSTPHAQTSSPLNSYHLQAPNGYADASYSVFINTTSYKNRGMAYVGANDGMLHAFNLGVILEQWSGQGTSEKAYLTGSDLGAESWGFVPKNALPYLKYMADTNYCHLYYVDAPTFLVDASVGAKGAGDISGSDKPSDGTTWRTILIGGMGFGGACKAAGTCSSSTTCVQSPITGAGLSSYFAIDVTDPGSPVLLWEFSDENLGYSTSGPAIVRIGGGSKNGKWFAVFASGPTGAVDTSYHQFKGVSDQNLKLFVIDLKSGSPTSFSGKNYLELTSVANAFGGSLYNASIDLQRGEPNATTTGNYQDDAVYLGYTKKCTGSESPTPAVACTAGTWTNGGVLRIMTKENADPTQWSVTQLIDGIGPITTAVTKLQDRGQKGSTPGLWLYFGTGRFYNKSGSTFDDQQGYRRLYGVKDPCYKTTTGGHAYMDTSCSNPDISGLSFDNKTSDVTTTASANGWYVNLDVTTTAGAQTAERVITDPLAVFSGNVFFTTFAPSADACTMGGNTFLWALNYKSGGVPTLPGGKALIQVSTGEIKQVNLSSIYTDKGGRRSGAITGVPPKGQGLSVLISPRPTRRILHIQEK